MRMKLYQKLKELDLVDDHKEFIELVRLRSIKINESIVDDPKIEIKEDDKIQIGIFILD